MPDHRLQLAKMTIGLLLVVGMATTTFAQGSGSSRTTPSPSKPPTIDEFATSFWQFINNPKAPYRLWASSAPAAVEGVESPHGAKGKVYFNDLAAKNLKLPPDGAIVIREDYEADGNKLRGFSIMYRETSATPNKTDWYWIGYQPNGTLAKTTVGEESKPIIGQAASCIACHGKAPGNDLMFSSELVPQTKTDK